MEFDFKGIKSSENRISDFIQYLEKVKDNAVWNYKGLKVKIDPTVDYNCNNVLVRWKDIDEDFNDRIIYYNLVAFKKEFRLLNA